MKTISIPLEKEMTTHSSTLAWRIPWAEEPGRLRSMGPQTVIHDLATKHHTKALMLTTAGCQWQSHMD